MAEIIVFCPNFVTYRFILWSQLVENKINKIITSYGGETPCPAFTDSSGVHEVLYEFPEKGTATCRIARGMTMLYSKGVVTQLKDKKYSGGAFVLLTGFKKEDSSPIKKKLEELAEEVNEKFT